MAFTHGLSQYHFDKIVVNKYINKMANAKKRDIDFLLTFDEFRSLYNRKYCPFLQIKLSLYSDSNQRRDSANAITIDRIDSSKGYVSGNVIACSNAANSLKSMFEKTVPLGLTLEQTQRMLTVTNRLMGQRKQE